MLRKASLACCGGASEGLELSSPSPGRRDLPRRRQRLLRLVRRASQWLRHGNPNPKPDYRVLHPPDCPRFDRSPSRKWTTDYIKICSDRPTNSKAGQEKVAAAT